MFSLNVSCAVCKAAFKQNEPINATSCGHIFHANCLSQCRNNYNSCCPVCRHCNPTAQPLYMHFENGLEYANVLNDIKAQLESCEAKNRNLQEEIEKKVKEKDRIKRLYNVSEQWRAELEDKIQILKQQQRQQQEQHTAELGKHLEEIVMLKTNIGILGKGGKTAEGGLNEQSKQLMLENIKIKKNLEECEAMKIQLNQKLEMQDHRLKLMTLELTKQIDENLKQGKTLEALQNKPLTKPPPSAAATAPTAAAVIKPKTLYPCQWKNTILKQTERSHALFSSTDNVAMFDIKEFTGLTLTQSDDSRLVISDFPSANLVYPLQDTIILLATKMAISLKPEDILYARLMPSYHRNGPFDNKVVILVEFKSIDIKTQFFKCTNRLRFDPSTQNIRIKEYIDKQNHQLFLYANRKLRASGGYEYIACKGKKVVARKKLNDTEEIVIRDQQHVDTLLRSATMNNALNSSSDLAFLL